MRENQRGEGTAAEWARTDDDEGHEGSQGPEGKEQENRESDAGGMKATSRGEIERRRGRTQEKQCGREWRAGIGVEGRTAGWGRRRGGEGWERKQREWKRSEAKTEWIGNEDD